MFLLCVFNVDFGDCKEYSSSAFVSERVSKIKFLYLKVVILLTWYRTNFAVG